MTEYFKPKVFNSADIIIYQTLKEKADEMRKHPTPAEAELWKYLNNNQMGVKFRRQHIIERYIVDFYCVEKGLVIEVDGEIHLNQIEEDKIREEVLKTLGCRILRFRNQEIFDEISSVLDRIREYLKKPPTP